MKAFVLKTPGIVGWHDSPDPILTPYGAILRPIVVSPCTSDVHTVFGGGSPKAPNLILGHECVGQIVKIGQLVKDFQEGDIVAVPAITPDWRALSIQENNFCHASRPFSGHQLGRTMPGVFAEYFSIPDADTTLARIPAQLSLEQALMCVDVVTTGFTAAESANIKFGDTVCVLGVGAIGLMAIVGARLLGAAQIIAVGTRPYCMTLAKKYGATHLLNYKKDDVTSKVLDLTNHIGADAVIIAGGGDNVLTQAYDMVRYGVGTISNVNYFGGSADLSIPKFSGGRGMCGKTLHMELAKGGRIRIERIMQMCQFKRFDPQNLVTHRLHGLEQIETALHMMRDKTNGLIKVAVKLNDVER